MRYRQPSFDVPEDKIIRVIIDTDAANEADDQFAIVQALLSPRLDIRGICAAHFGEEKSPHSMEDSYHEICKVVGLLNRKRDVFHMPIYRGAEKALTSDADTPSEGAQAIAAEALLADEHPLFVICLGALTNVASALRAHPAIADGMTLIWIGGNAYPAGGWEYNLKTDPIAARLVFSSSVPLWQVPRNGYQKMLVSMAELSVQVRSQGELGRYLFDHMVEWGHSFWGRRSKLRTGECWYLGDSPAVGLLLNEHEFCYRCQRAPDILDDLSYAPNDTNRVIRVYEQIDSRFILSDLYAKLALLERGE